MTHGNYSFRRLWRLDRLDEALLVVGECIAAAALRDREDESDFVRECLDHFDREFEDLEQFLPDPAAFLSAAVSGSSWYADFLTLNEAISEAQADRPDLASGIDCLHPISFLLMAVEMAASSVVIDPADVSRSCVQRRVNAIYDAVGLPFDTSFVAGRLAGALESMLDTSDSEDKSELVGAARTAADVWSIFAPVSGTIASMALSAIDDNPGLQGGAAPRDDLLAYAVAMTALSLARDLLGEDAAIGPARAIASKMLGALDATGARLSRAGYGDNPKGEVAFRRAQAVAYAYMFSFEGVISNANDVPSLLGMTLMDATRVLDALGVAHTPSDSSGRGRGVWEPRNWIVVEQAPSTGGTFSIGVAKPSEI